MNIRPNKSELLFLTLAYNRFYDIFDLVMQDSFTEKDSFYRFSKVKDGFAVYTEILNYEPIKWTIQEIKKSRPPMEGEIAGELFKFVRNVISHFPFYDNWDSVFIQKLLVNWYKEGQTIDSFLNKYVGHIPVKYRF